MVERDLHSIAFPVLSEAQMTALAGCTGGVTTHYPSGQVLIEAGERNFKFYAVKSGEIEIIDITGSAPRTVVVHGPGHFTGDVSHLTGSPSIIRAITRGECELLELSTEVIRKVLNQCPDLGDILMQAFIARRQLLREMGGFTGLRVIGSKYSKDTFRIRDFLARNRILFSWLDLEADPEVEHLLKHFGLTEADTPIVACAELIVLRNPSNRELAELNGIRQPLDDSLYDLVVVGAGPAGLAAAVYGASEGLSTVVLEASAPGGQAGRSMRIENYLGFPTGITGSELADRATLQADKFGARLSIASPLTHVSFEGPYVVVTLDSGENITAKCLLIATGADYRRLGVDGCDQYEGCGVYYAATPNEVQLCRTETAVVVGGGNSAGQAAVFLAGRVQRVVLVVRDKDLTRKMSAYLARRIQQTPNIEVLLEATVERMTGDTQLRRVEIAFRGKSERRTIETQGLFSFIGASPRTEWLPKEVETDARGFVHTGRAGDRATSWNRPREPFLLETSRPGVFAAGDVRAGSVKRVASAVGEGSMAVQFVHEYLKEM